MSTTASPPATTCSMTASCSPRKVSYPNTRCSVARASLSVTAISAIPPIPPIDPSPVRRPSTTVSTIGAPADRPGVFHRRPAGTPSPAVRGAPSRPRRAERQDQAVRAPPVVVRAPLHLGEAQAAVERQRRVVGRFDGQPDLLGAVLPQPVHARARQCTPPAAPARPARHAQGQHPAAASVGRPGGDRVPDEAVAVVVQDEHPGAAEVVELPQHEVRVGPVREQLLVQAGQRGQIALPHRSHVQHGPLPIPRSPPYALCAPRVRPRAPEDVRRTSGHGRPGPLLSTGGSTRDARSSGTTNRPPRRGRGPPLGRLRSGRL